MVWLGLSTKPFGEGSGKKKIIVWLKLHVLVATIMHGNDQTSLEKDPGIYGVYITECFFLKDTWGHFQLLIYRFMCGCPPKYPDGNQPFGSLVGL